MKRQELTNQVIEMIKPIFNAVDTEENVYLNESQKEFIEEVWGDYPEFNNTTNDSLMEIIEELAEIENYI